MGLFSFLKKDSTPAMPQSKGDLVNMLKSREGRERVKKIIVELVEQTKQLTRKDIEAWRTAWQRAISVEYPSRILLNSVYRDIKIDNHLLGIVGQILKEILQKEFIIVDRNTDEEIEGLKGVLDDAQWFIDFCKHAIETELEGFKLLQFGEVIEVNGIQKFDEIEQVDADHVVPDHLVFLINQGDHYTNGIDFTVPPYNAYCVGIGNKKNLGLYNAIAPHAISKKNVLAFWDKFAEIFGMPMRIGKTSSNNKKDRDEVAEMLQNMGSAAWGMFPDGTEIDIKETTRGDAYEVYDKRVERANSEMSKAIVHQTMTTDNGSSKSQSETHLNIQEKVIAYYAKVLRIIINDKLIPFMVARGFKGWENAKFKFDETVEYSVKEQLDIEKLMLEHFDIPESFFLEKYNIPVEKKKTPAPIVPPNPDPSDKTKPSNAFFD